jgi:hypothetical protein
MAGPVVFETGDSGLGVVVKKPGAERVLGAPPAITAPQFRTVPDTTRSSVSPGLLLLTMPFDAADCILRLRR